MIEAIKNKTHEDSRQKYVSREYSSRLNVIACVLITILLSGCSLGFGGEAVSSKDNYSRDWAVTPKRLVKNKVKGKSNNGRAEDVKYPALVVLDTPEVRHFVSVFKTSQRPFMEQSLTRKEQCYPVVSDVLREFGLPGRLFGVPIVESMLDPEARSQRGAVGLWQIMPHTARYLGLEVSFFADHRKNVALSTTAAARYLAELYDKYDDWYLALAAYNAGAGNVSKAIQDGGSRDFFVLARKGLLPKETTEFVPKVLAASLISADPKRFGFDVSNKGGSRLLKSDEMSVQDYRYSFLESGVRVIE